MRPSLLFLSANVNMQTKNYTRWNERIDVACMDSDGEPMLGCAWRVPRHRLTEVALQTMCLTCPAHVKVSFGWSRYRDDARSPCRRRRSKLSFNSQNARNLSTLRREKETCTHETGYKPRTRKEATPTIIGNDSQLKSSSVNGLLSACLSLACRVDCPIPLSCLARLSTSRTRPRGTSCGRRTLRCSVSHLPGATLS